MTKSNIFISYSHKDEEYKNRLVIHLKSLQNIGLAHIWDTSTIVAGDDWNKAIRKSIENTEIAILLVSPDFIASQYVYEQELPLLFQNYKSRKTIILPILVRPTHWVSIPQLTEFQFLNDVRSPLSESNDINDDVSKIAKKIIDIVYANQGKIRATEVLLAKNENKKPSFAKEKDKNIQVFLSHSKKDGDFAELMKLRLEKEEFSAWIDNDRLEAGVDWRQEIDESIKQSKALVVIMSPEARESEYVTYEWAYAWGLGISIIPIMLRETPLHPRLASLQYLDFTNRRSRPWLELIKTIKSKANKNIN